jgi:hypothetical protein
MWIIWKSEANLATRISLITFLNGGPGFVSGDGFSRAAARSLEFGFSRCHFAGAKALLFFELCGTTEVVP